MISNIDKKLQLTMENQKKCIHRVAMKDSIYCDVLQSLQAITRAPFGCYIFSVWDCVKSFIETYNYFVSFVCIKNTGCSQNLQLHCIICMYIKQAVHKTNQFVLFIYTPQDIVTDNFLINLPSCFTCGLYTTLCSQYISIVILCQYLTNIVTRFHNQSTSEYIMAFCPQCNQHLDQVQIFMRATRHPPYVPGSMLHHYIMLHDINIMCHITR